VASVPPDFSIRHDKLIAQTHPTLRVASRLSIDVIIPDLTARRVAKAVTFLNVRCLIADISDM
jgi:hypothetical protein